MPDADTRFAMIDVLHRFAAGQDLNDAGLFRSAFTADAVLDFVQPAAKLDVALEPFEGLEQIAGAVLSATASLDTTHTVTNVRVVADEGDRARLHALVEAQHLPHGDHTRHLKLKNHYHVDVVRDGDAWRAHHMLIENVWYTGDPSVLFPA